MLSVFWICVIVIFGTSLCNDVVYQITMGKTTWGKWGRSSVCPPGTYITGFRLRVESNKRDNTALNGIQLICSDGTYTRRINGFWGKWRGWKYCDGKLTKGTDKYVTGFNFRSQGKQKKDDTAGNDVKMQCNDKTELFGGGSKWGTWDRDKYEQCPPGTYFCGVQAKIEGKQGVFRDDTALNRLKFLCCKSGDRQWDLWNSWTACSATCGGGTQSRNRSCEKLPRGGLLCLNDGARKAVDSEEQSCNNKLCSDNWIIIAVVAGLVIIITAIIICCVRRRKARKNEMYEGVNRAQTDNDNDNSFPAATHDAYMDPKDMEHDDSSLIKEQQYEEIPYMTNIRSSENPYKGWGGGNNVPLNKNDHQYEELPSTIKNRDNEYNLPKFDNVAQPCSGKSTTGNPHGEVRPVFRPRPSDSPTQEYTELDLSKPGINEMENSNCQYAPLEPSDDNNLPISEKQTIKNASYDNPNSEYIPMSNIVSEPYSHEPVTGNLHAEFPTEYKPGHSGSTPQEYDELNLSKPGILHEEFPPVYKPGNTGSSPQEYDELNLYKPGDSESSTQEYDELNLSKPGIDRMQNGNTNTKNNPIDSSTYDVLQR